MKTWYTIRNIEKKTDVLDTINKKDVIDYLSDKDLRFLGRKFLVKS